jgi:hypothetical protein
LDDAVYRRVVRIETLDLAQAVELLLGFIQDRGQPEPGPLVVRFFADQSRQLAAGLCALSCLCGMDRFVKQRVGHGAARGVFVCVVCI